MFLAEHYHSIMKQWLAVDIGGANLKAAHTSGAACAEPFALWKSPDQLAERLRALAGLLPAFDMVAVTMTAELCDCFATKNDGVRHVLDAVESAFNGREIRVWTLDGRFRGVAEVRIEPASAAASNWLALASVAARLLPAEASILVDVGSTTTDLIPLSGGNVAARGRTDLSRMRHGELVYVGIRRTPACAVAASIELFGFETPLAAELFATTNDVYLALGSTVEDQEDRDTADGRPSTRAYALARLARSVCADLNELNVDAALAIARALDEIVVARLVAAARNACEATVGAPRAAIVAGSGSIVANRVARALVGTHGNVLNLSELWSPAAADAACAFALIELVRNANLNCS